MICENTCLKYIKKYSVIWFILSILGLSTVLTLVFTYHYVLFKPQDTVTSTVTVQPNSNLPTFGDVGTTARPYECPSTTGINNRPIMPSKNVFAIWTAGGKHEPSVTQALVLDSDMNIITSIGSFRGVENFSIKVSCSVHYQGQMYFLGGGFTLRQSTVSRLVNCQLKHVGMLAVKYEFASCAATQNEIIMCFNSPTRKLCHKVITNICLASS